MTTYSQCSCDGFFAGTYDASWIQPGNPSHVVSIQSGWLFEINNLIPGATYQVSSCEASFDSELTIFTTNCELLSFSNNDPTNSCTFFQRGVSSIEAPQNGSIRLKITQENCSTNLEHVPIILTLKNLPECETIATINSTETSICQGEFVTFQISLIDAGTNPSLDWQLNGFSLGEFSEQISINYLNSGDTIDCIVNVNDGCSNSLLVSSNSIIIEHVSELIIPEFDPINSICQSDSLIPLSTISINGISGIWFADSANTVPNNFVFYPSDGQCAVATSMILNVYPNPILSLSLNGATLNATPGFTNYQWYLDGELLLGESSFYIFPTINGEYMVEVSDENGCQNFTTYTYQNATSLENYEDLFSVYPNPSNGQFNVNFKDAQLRTVEIYDNHGKLLYQEHLYNIENTVNPVHLSSGFYFLTVKQAEHNFQRKFIIEN